MQSECVDFCAAADCACQMDEGSSLGASRQDEAGQWLELICEVIDEFFESCNVFGGDT